MDQAERSKANRRLISRLGMVVIGMFGFGFALVPLYDVFCDITGLNGKTGRIGQNDAQSLQVDDERLVTVEFVAIVNGGLPWEFRPLVREIKVHPGAVTEVSYYARNRSNREVAGQAVPSLVPGLAASHFNKTECFCFTRQTLGPGEEKEMPLRFVIDRDLPEDITNVALSYTFFEQEQTAGTKREGQEPG